jgi:DNA mismatch repair protein MSH2
MLERWLRQPLKDLAVIESRQDIVGVFLGAPVLRSALAEGPLRRAPDLESLRVRMQKKKAGLAEIFKLYGFAMTVPSFCDALGGADQELDEMGMDILRGQFTARFELLRDELVKFEELAEHVLDLSQLPDLRVNPEYSEELAELRAGMIEIEANISKIHAKAKKTWANLGEKSPCLLEKDKVRGGFIYRMTNSNVTSELKKRCPSVEITAILKNGVHFKCRDLRQASQKYVELAEQYEQQQKDLVTKALETANTYMPVMEIASEIVAELDVFVALATAAALAPIEYVRPKMLPAGTGVLKVEAARHPCLECQDDLDFIPNSYSMTKDKGRFLVVTGPNMGGKSTFIRTLGSIVVMAQMGSFVPADSAEISVVDAIFARVGAGDAQQRGVSTFMAEMLEASAILSSATDQSLIVVDELGRGTSTYDGFGLAWGISQYIVRELGAFTLFATHFHEMTTLADCETCVDNVHVSAKTEEDNITMLYHVKPGPCLQSFGIHVASMAGFPNSVIKEAKKKAAELERFETAMENLELQNSEGLKKRPAEEGKGMDSKRLHQAAEQFKNLPLDGMSPAEVLQAAMQLVSCMEAPKD